MKTLHFLRFFARSAHTLVPAVISLACYPVGNNIEASMEVPIFGNKSDPKKENIGVGAYFEWGALGFGGP